MGRLIVASNNKRDIRGAIIAVRTYAIRNNFSSMEGVTFDSAFASIVRDLVHLESKLGTVKAGKLHSMLDQAKMHFEAGHAPGGDDGQVTLGARLMQDMEYILMDKAHESYPNELWRWG